MRGAKRGSQRYFVPPIGEAALSYCGLPYDLLEDLLPLSGAWKQTLPFLMPREDVATGRPITPLHGGHVGLLCTAGLLNGVFGQGDDRHIARWRSVKHVTTFVEEDGNEQIIHHRERWTNELRLVYADGRTLKLTETPARPEDLTEKHTLELHGDAFNLLNTAEFSYVCPR
jgi:hypothetical protein